MILDDVALRVAWMGVVPLVGREPRHDKESETDQDVGGHDVLEKRTAHHQITARYHFNFEQLTSQISTANGFMKEKSLVGWLVGICLFLFSFFFLVSY